MTSVRARGRLATWLLLGVLAHGARLDARDTGAPSRIAAPAAVSGRLSMAAAGTLVVLAWGTGGARPGAFVAVSRDVGASFAAPTSLGGGTWAPDGVAPAVFISADGQQVRVAWPAARGERRGVATAVSRDSGRTFTAVHVPLPAGVPVEATLSALRYADSGELHALWLVGARLWYTKAAHETPIAPITVDDRVSGCAVTALVADAKGVGIFWYRTFGPGDEEFAYRRLTPGGALDGDMRRLSQERWGFQTCPGTHPSVTVDDRGALRFAFRATLPGAVGAYLLTDRSPDGRSFLPRSHLDVTGFSDVTHPHVASDRQGGLAMVWDGQRNGRRYVMVRHSLGSPDGRGGLTADWGRPSPPQVLDSSGQGRAPVLVASGGGMVAAWVREAPGGTVVMAVPLTIDQLCGLPARGR